MQPVSVQDVISAIGRLPDKSLAVEPLPVPMLKRVAAEIASFLSQLFNSSLATGCFPQHFKKAFITPVLKKFNLDSAEVRSYRLISNLSMVSKLLERVVVGQIVSYLLTMIYYCDITITF
jgi:hypothetical protein